MQSERLPSLNYRISADYGTVAVAKSKSFQSDDLFGSVMNLCTKINSKARANDMVIGEELYQLVKSIEDFRFERVQENLILITAIILHILYKLEKRGIF